MAATNDSTNNAALGSVECPSALFAKGLKTYGTRTYRNIPHTAEMVVGFDKEKFKNTCLAGKNSPTYNPSLCNFDAIANELFKAGEKWESRDLLHDAFKCLGRLHGWIPSLQQQKMMCNRFGQSSTSRDYVGGTLKVECTCKLDITPLVKEKYFAKKESKKASYKDIWGEPVMIKNANCEHGGSVVVRNEAVEVELNGRNVTHCGFCKEESHAFTTCPNREAFKMNAQEYILSSKFATNQQALRSRIGSMPHSRAQEVEGLSYLSCSITQLRSNFVLHEARIMVDSFMYYHVSFLNEHAQPGEKSWISWDVMNTIITHSNVKKKFVFDETITHKQGWIHQNVSASSVGLLGAASVSNDGNAVLSFHDTSKRKSPSSLSVVTDKPQHEQEASKPSTPKRLYRVASEKEQASSKPS